jgi:hypothetical protein
VIGLYSVSGVQELVAVALWHIVTEVVPGVWTASYGGIPVPVITIPAVIARGDPIWTVGLPLVVLPPGPSVNVVLVFEDVALAEIVIEFAAVFTAVT